MTEVSASISRQGFLIIIDGLGCSVTFYPIDKDKTFNAVMDKLKELGLDVSNHERMNLDVQLTNVYKEYTEQRADRKISEPSI